MDVKMVATKCSSQMILKEQTEQGFKNNRYVVAMLKICKTLSMINFDLIDSLRKLPPSKAVTDPPPPPQSLPFATRPPPSSNHKKLTPLTLESGGGR